MVEDTAEYQDSSTNEARFPWSDRKTLLLISAVLLITFLTFLPSLQNGFVNWDDQISVYQNPNLTSISDLSSFVNSVVAIFTSDVLGNYNPLPIFTFALESVFWGLDSPQWMHLTNILLHLICVYLVFRISLSLGLSPIGAAFCALLFGIHPLRVESVVWITERKDVLLGTFYFLALDYYIRATKSSDPKRYSWRILLCFLLALLSKIQAVALPLSMLAVDYYCGRKLNLKLVLEKWLYFALSLVTGVAGILFLRADGSIQNNNLFPFLERVFIGTYSYCVYLIKSVIPYQMVPVYPYPATLDWRYYASLVPIILLIGLAIYLYRADKKIPVFGLLFFTVNIMFVLQVLGAGQGFLADRFTYIPYFGLYFMYAFGFQWLLRRYSAYTYVIHGAALLILTVFGSLSFAQTGIWKNGETLWSHVLKHFPATSLAWENRGSYYEERGRISEAYHDYSKAISLKPTNPIAYFSRGSLYLRSQDPQQLQSALQDFNRALELSPGTSAFLVNRGIVLVQLEQLNQALQDFIAAENRTPGRADIFFYRSRIYYKLNQFDRAQADLESYLELNPADSSMWSNLGMVARLNKRYEESIRAFDRAMQIDPDHLDYRYKQAITFYEMDDIRRAREILRALQEKGFQGIHPEFEKRLNQGR